MSLKFLCPASLIVLGACAAPQQRSTTASNVRAESGALSQDDFLNAPWRSSNIQQTAMEDGRVKMVVMAIDEAGKIDRDMTEYLETELNALQRFPIESTISGGSVSDTVSELFDLGEVDTEEGTNAQIGYVLEWRLKKMNAVLTPEEFKPLLNISANLHEYWYEGPLNMFQVGGAGKKAIWADRTFRSKSAWKFESVSLKGKHVGLHDPSDEKQRQAAWDETKSSMLFNFSKEVYSKLGREAAVENAVKSGADVLMSTALGSTDGVVQGQPMFVTYKMGNLQIMLAKAIVENPSAEGSTLRVIQWNRGESLAEEFAADPTAFISRNLSAIVARTEGLALPESWSERSAALELLLEKYADDGREFMEKVNAPKERTDAMVALLKSR